MGPADLDDAISIATASHHQQYDKAGEPYILHPIRVMLRMTTYDERIVAILHDVVEDTDVTLPELHDLGFPSFILDALADLTHEEGESYTDYIERIKAGSKLAQRVKLADLSDNLNRSRIPFPSDRDVKRWAKYEAAYQRLTEE